MRFSQRPIKMSSACVTHPLNCTRRSAERSNKAARWPLLCWGSRTHQLASNPPHFLPRALACWAWAARVLPHQRQQKARASHESRAALHYAHLCNPCGYQFQYLIPMPYESAFNCAERINFLLRSLPTAPEAQRGSCHKWLPASEPAQKRPPNF